MQEYSTVPYREFRERYQRETRVSAWCFIYIAMMAVPSLCFALENGYEPAIVTGVGLLVFFGDVFAFTLGSLLHLSILLRSVRGVPNTAGAWYWIAVIGWTIIWLFVPALFVANIVLHVLSSVRDLVF